MAEKEIADEEYFKILKKIVIQSLHKGSLAKGLHEVCKALEAVKKPEFCILDKNCNENNYMKLVKALCK